MILSFGGSGYGFPFYVGVYKALIELYGYDELSTWQISGASSGSVAALCICAGIPLEDVLSFIRGNTSVQKYHGPCYGHICLLFWLLCMKDLHVKVGNRLRISIMKFFWNVTHKNVFQDDDDICSTILKSCSIPFFSFFMTSDIDPCFYHHITSPVEIEEEIIFISVLDDLDISMCDEITFYDLTGCISTERCDKLIELGYTRTLLFFQNGNKKSKIKKKFKTHKCVFFKPFFGWLFALLHTILLLIWYSVYYIILRVLNILLTGKTRYIMLWFMK